MELIIRNDGTDVKEWIGGKMHINGCPVTVLMHKPDTCDCVCYEAWNDSLTGDDHANQTPVAYHEHPLKGEAFKMCAAHAACADHQELHSVVKAENAKKNRAWEEVKSQVDPSVKDQVKWEIDENRNIVITVPASENADSITTNEEGVIIQ